MNQIYTILLAVGAVQGLVLGGLLFSKVSINKKANRIVAILLFFMSYRLFVECGNSYGIGWVSHWSYHLLFEYNWIYGSLLYFYIRTYFQKDIKWIKSDYWHFAPIFVEFLFSNWVKVQNLFWNGSIESLSSFGAWSYQIWEHTPLQFIVAAGIILFYTVKSKQFIDAFKQKEQVVLQASSLSWIKQILFTYQVFSILTIILVLVDYLFFNYAFNSFYQFPIYIIMAILTYWLGLQAYNKRDEIVSKVAKSNSQLEQLARLAAQLDHLMEKERLFLNPNLNLAELAAQMKVKSYLITQALNQIKSQKFNDYINTLRVTEFQRLLSHPNYQHYSLLALAFEAGFNSKASFNRIVKKMTGMSPSALKE